MELKFDNKRHRVKYCPCNKSNKDGKFVPYENQEKYGYCHSCDKVYLPETDYKSISYTIPNEPVEVDLIDREVVKKSWNKYEINSFAIFLKSTFGTHAEKLIKDFCLGTTKDNGVIFWQIDEQLQTRTGKIMHYDSKTGKRLQHKNPTWIHSLLELTMKQCLFGLHQINTKPTNQDIHIVESEKTAIIMSHFQPHIIWMASGGSTGLQSHKFEALRGRKICLFPDHGKYDLWEEQKDRLQFEFPSITFTKSSIECEKWFNENELEKGGDIADFYLAKAVIKPKNWVRFEK